MAGKGVEELNTEYQGELKQMGLQLQKEQVEATKANQEAERRQAEVTQKQSAQEKVAGRTLAQRLADKVLGNPAEAALEKSATGGTGYAPDVLAYAQKHGITPELAQEQKNRRTKGQ